MLWAVVPLAVVVGCNQHCFMTESDYNHCRNVALSPLPGCGDTVDGKPSPVFAPVRTTLNPDAEKRYISLAEAVALALENGRVGGANIRVLAFNPALAQTNIEQALATFDARWTTSMTWNRIDEIANNATNNTVVQLAGLLNGLGLTTSPFIKEDQATFESTISKPLPTGGVAGITFRTDYEFNNQSIGGLNPVYFSRLIFNFEQPLLRGAGVEINQISSGILLSRIGFEQSRTAFAGSVMDMLFQVESAYWNLYDAYWNLYSTDLALQEALNQWQLANARATADVVRKQVLYQIEQQYQGFRLGRLDALAGVLEAERQLRFVTGLPPEDGCRLVPNDEPTIAPFQPDWCVAVNEALANRPELIEIRQELKGLQLQLRRAKNLTWPDLRFISQYDINGSGDRLDGNDNAAATGLPANAFRSLASNHFNDWTIGLRLDVPIGFRDAHAQVRRVELQLGQRLTQLRDQEAQAAFALQQSYRNLVQSQERLQVLATLKRVANDQLVLRQKEFKILMDSKDVPDPTALITALVDAQRSALAAQIDERRGVTQYNIALADFERQKGTLLAHNNVNISDGPLPACVESEASRHIRERDHAFTVRNRPPDCTCGGAVQQCCGAGAAPGMPHLGDTLPPTAAPARPAEALPAPLPADGKKSVSLDRPAVTPLPVSRYPELTPQQP
jgi:outer membrane protein TolC